MDFQWNKYTLWQKIILCAVVAALLSCCMNWVKVMGYSNTGIERSIPIVLLPWIYFGIRIIYQKKINWLLGILCAFLALLYANFIFYISICRIVNNSIYATKEYGASGEILFVMAFMAFCLGLIMSEKDQWEDLSWKRLIWISYFGAGIGCISLLFTAIKHQTPEIVFNVFVLAILSLLLWGYPCTILKKAKKMNLSVLIGTDILLGVPMAGYAGVKFFNCFETGYEILILSVLILWGGTYLYYLQRNQIQDTASATSDTLPVPDTQASPQWMQILLKLKSVAIAEKVVLISALLAFIAICMHQKLTMANQGQLTFTHEYTFVLLFIAIVCWGYPVYAVLFQKMQLRSATLVCCVLSLLITLVMALRMYQVEGTNVSYGMYHVDMIQTQSWAAPGIVLFWISSLILLVAVDYITCCARKKVESK